MIKLDISSAVSLYLSLSVIVILFAWAFIDRKRKDRLKVENESIWECSICAFTYVDSMHDELSTCPRCGSFNKRGAQIKENFKKRIQKT